MYWPVPSIPVVYQQRNVLLMYLFTLVLVSKCQIKMEMDFKQLRNLPATNNRSKSAAKSWNAEIQHMTNSMIIVIYTKKFPRFSW